MERLLPVASETFALLVPVKSLDSAKTRLRLDDATTRRLMVAFTRDAVTAARRSPLVGAVHLVTGERALAERLGVSLLPDEGAGDLNRALAAAAARVTARDPATGLAVMCADLPCLVEDDLTAALAAAPSPRWCVTDTEGTGTTLLVARAGEDLAPAFGPASASHHVRSGATAVPDALVTLRHDVDTPADLERAVGLGLGEHTARALAARAS